MLIKKNKILTILILIASKIIPYINATEPIRNLDVNKESIFIKKDSDNGPDHYTSILGGCQQILADHRDVSATMMSLVIATEHAKQNNLPEPKFNLCDLIISARNAAYRSKFNKPYINKKNQDCCCKKTKAILINSKNRKNCIKKYQEINRNINFCQYNLGIDRKDMPQLSGKPINDTCLAAQLAKEGKVPVEYGKDGSIKNIDLTDIFVQYLEQKGFKVSIKNIDAFQLKATQKELIASKVAGMWFALKIDPNNKELKASIFTAAREYDGSYYILDGHHRWAAIMATEFGLSHLTKVFLPAKVVNTDIAILLAIANKFTQDYGIAVKNGS